MSLLNDLVKMFSGQHPLPTPLQHQQPASQPQDTGWRPTYSPSDFNATPQQIRTMLSQPIYAPTPTQAGIPAFSPTPMGSTVNMTTGPPQPQQAVQRQAAYSPNQLQVQPQQHLQNMQPNLGVGSSPVQGGQYNPGYTPMQNSGVRTGGYSAGIQPAPYIQGPQNLGQQNPQLNDNGYFWNN